jgi:hypothetical protein
MHAGKSNVKQARRAITKQQREHAATLHRSSVLCLAARLMLLDRAADDALVQVESWNFGLAVTYVSGIRDCLVLQHMIAGLITGCRHWSFQSLSRIWSAC